MSSKMSARISIAQMPKRLPKLLYAAVCLSWLAGTTAPAHAEIVLGGRDVNGVLDGSGTNKNPAPFSLSSYEASFGTYLATPISPHYFVTAAHIGNGNGNGVLTFNNGTTTTSTYTATLAGTDNDLAIWHVTSGAFSLYAPLFTASNEVGKPIVGIGNGTTRGNALTINGQLTGWDVGQSLTNRSWQTNTVSNIATGNSNDDYLVMDFHRIADPATGTVINPDEGILSGGDSGGAVFVLDPVTGMYELGGINYGVYTVSLTSGGTPQTLALFDARGYYDYDPSTGAYTQLITDSSPVPLISYASRISSQLSFFQQTLGSEYNSPLTPLAGNRGYSTGAVPEPGAVALLLSLGLTGANFLVRRKRIRQ